MKLPSHAFFWLLALVTTIHALALPASFNALVDSSKELYKRKGGGGGGGKGGGGTSSSGGSSSGSRGGGSSGGGSSSSSSGSTGSRGSGLTSSSSNTGGRTAQGSGLRPSYGRGGGYYAGGAAVPYRAGRATNGIAPKLLLGSALVFPALWLYGAYMYPYNQAWTYHNDTANRNETHPVQCYCAEYQSCGCEDNTDQAYRQSVANNQSIAQLADVNGTETLVINGTLENGTTAAGGSDSAANGWRQSALESSGWWVVIAGVCYTVLTV